MLRPITPADHAAVLAWNEANVEVLSPLDEPRLVQLLGWSDTGAVITHDGVDVGFVLTFAAGSSYDSENFGWFAARHERFLYLDRIVLDGSVRRTGLGSAVYDEVEARAAELGPVLCLEVNSVPPNEPSLAFHRKRGFVELGERDYRDTVVTLFEKTLTAPW